MRESWDSNEMEQRRKRPSQQYFNLQKADEVKTAIEKDKNDQVTGKDFWQQR